ncbi:MAG: hypothetical protein AAFZ15_22230 [Bacteroidota bacterium]
MINILIDKKQIKLKSLIENLKDNFIDKKLVEIFGPITATEKEWDETICNFENKQLTQFKDLFNFAWLNDHFRKYPLRQFHSRSEY